MNFKTQTTEAQESGTLPGNVAKYITAYSGSTPGVVSWFFGSPRTAQPTTSDAWPTRLTWL